MNKKLLTTFALSAALTLGLAGCTGDNTPKPEKTPGKETVKKEEVKKISASEILDKSLAALDKATIFSMDLDYDIKTNNGETDEEIKMKIAADIHKSTGESYMKTGVEGQEIEIYVDKNTVLHVKDPSTGEWMTIDDEMTKSQMSEMKNMIEQQKKMNEEMKKLDKYMKVKETDTSYIVVLDTKGADKKELESYLISSLSSLQMENAMDSIKEVVIFSESVIDKKTFETTSGTSSVKLVMAEQGVEATTIVDIKINKFGLDQISEIKKPEGL